MLDYLRRYPEFILLAMGATFLAGAIFNWSLITGLNSTRKNPFIKLSLYLFGINGYRIIMGLMGIVFLAISIYGLLEK